MTPTIKLPAKKRARLSFNDSIEVYYYPENMKQHEHHQKYDSYDFEESQDLSSLDEI